MLTRLSRLEHRNRETINELEVAYTESQKLFIIIGNSISSPITYQAVNLGGFLNEQMTVITLEVVEDNGELAVAVAEIAPLVTCFSENDQFYYNGLYILSVPLWKVYSKLNNEWCS